MLVVFSQKLHCDLYAEVSCTVTLARESDKQRTCKNVVFGHSV